ncbi:unnamed protein product, partial [Ectocarpus sp. 12 AP-2014]
GARGLELSLPWPDTAHRVAHLRRTCPEVRGKNTTGASLSKLCMEFYAEEQMLNNPARLLISWQELGGQGL